GAHGRQPGAADDLRHGQGARQRHGHRGSPPAREDRRQERRLARGMKPALPLDVAQQRLLALARPLGPELVPTRECLGRHLWLGLPAERTQPAGDLSAMDGYAVHEAVEGFWRVVGESAAGRPYAAALGPGEAVRISTGALMPRGARAVLLQE